MIFRKDAQIKALKDELNILSKRMQYLEDLSLILSDRIKEEEKRKVIIGCDVEKYMKENNDDRKKHFDHYLNHAKIVEGYLEGFNLILNHIIAVADKNATEITDER